MEYEYPQLSLLIITLEYKPTKLDQGLILLFHANVFNGIKPALNTLFCSQ